jgi:hypothetical protein
MWSSHKEKPPRKAALERSKMSYAVVFLIGMSLGCVLQSFINQWEEEDEVDATKSSE